MHNWRNKIAPRVRYMQWGATIAKIDGEPLGKKASDKMKAEQDASSIKQRTAILNSEHQSRIDGNRVKIDEANSKSIRHDITNQALLDGANVLSSALNTQSVVDTNEAQSGVKDAITSAISMIPGWGTAAAAALKVADAVGNATGLNLDAMSKEQSDAAGISGISRFANNAFGALPANFLGAAVGNTVNAYNTREVKELSNAFGGTSMDIDTANTMGGKSYLFGKRQANNFIGEMNKNVDTITTLQRSNAIRKNANNITDTNNYVSGLYEGRSAADRTYIGKNGMKLMSSADAKSLLSSMKNGGSTKELNSELTSLVALMVGYAKNDKSTVIGAEQALSEAEHMNGYTYEERTIDTALRTMQNPAEEIIRLGNMYCDDIKKKLQNNPDGLNAFVQMMQNFTPETVYNAAYYLNDALGGKLQMFQNGGTIGIDTNILPEGALHKNKNHLEDVNPEVGSEVTEKGIPVIVTDSEGNIEQVAEIEKEEIILRKEITKRIEELWKDGSDDAMIEAGKILAEEIITNTQDNTGQLDGNDNNNN